MTWPVGWVGLDCIFLESIHSLLETFPVHKNPFTMFTSITKLNSYLFRRKRSDSGLIVIQ